MPFNYTALPADVAEAVRSHTAQIKALARRTAEGVIGIGQALIAVKETLGHGQFERWIEVEFGWSDQTARRFMQTARLAIENPQIVAFEIDLSALYLLAQPSTPPEVTAEILERADAGERITHKAVRAALEPEAEVRPEFADDEIVDYVPAPKPPRKSSSGSGDNVIRPDPTTQMAGDILDFLCRVPVDKYLPADAAGITDQQMVEAIDRYFDRTLEWVERWADAWRHARNEKRRGVGRAA